MKLTAQLETEGAKALQLSQSHEKAFRDGAWAQHLKMGWPSLKTESWHYTNSSELLQSSMAIGQVEEKVSAELSEFVKKLSQEFYVLTFHNGQLLKGHSELMDGVKVETLQDHWQQLQELNIQWNDGLSAALAARATHGFWLEIKEKAQLKKPILLLHANEQGAKAVHDLKVFNINCETQCSIVEMYLGAQQSLQFSQTIAQVQANAKLQYGRLLKQRSSARHYSETQIILHEKSELKALAVNLGLDWSRSLLQVHLKEKSAEAYLSGIGFGSANQHNDQRVEARHHCGHTKSRQLYKGILRDRARGILNGKIYIAKGADQVDSAQINHNLLLSSLAEVDTKPELEVYADDVKANHGASIGRLDEEKLFYFLSRGISREAATQILAEGFVSDVIAKVDDLKIRTLLANEIKEILPQYSQGLEAGEKR